jgi:hypothetical protein
MLIAIAVFIVGLLILGLLALIVGRRTMPLTKAELALLQPRIDRMAEVSKALAGGLTLVAAVFAFVTTRGGGGGRILSNSPDLVYIGVALAALSVVVALGAMTALATAPDRGLAGGWLALNVLSILLFVSALAFLLSAADDAAKKFERPSLSASLTNDVITFESSLPLMKADETLTVTVYAFPFGWEDVELEPDEPGGSRGSELYRSTSGPAADGTSTTKGSVKTPATGIELVEVRAFRNDDDSGCFDSPPEAIPTACVQLWIVPQPPINGG